MGYLVCIFLYLDPNGLGFTHQDLEDMPIDGLILMYEVACLMKQDIDR